MQTQAYGVRRPVDLDSTFVEITGRGAASLLVLADRMFSAHTRLIADLANQHRLPAMYGLREYAADGGLMADGTN